MFAATFPDVKGYNYEDQFYIFTPRGRVGGVNEHISNRTNDRVITNFKGLGKTRKICQENENRTRNKITVLKMYSIKLTGILFNYVSFPEIKTQITVIFLNIPFTFKTMYHILFRNPCIIPHHLEVIRGFLKI